MFWSLGIQGTWLCDSLLTNESSTSESDEEKARYINRHLKLLSVFFQRTETRPVQSQTQTHQTRLEPQTESQLQAQETVISVLSDIAPHVANFALQRASWDVNTALNLLFDPDELNTMKWVIIFLS